MAMFQIYRSTQQIIHWHHQTILDKSGIGGVHIYRSTGLSCHGVGEAEDGSPENVSIGGTKVPRSE